MRPAVRPRTPLCQFVPARIMTRGLLSCFVAELLGFLSSATEQPSNPATCSSAEVRTSNSTACRSAFIRSNSAQSCQATSSFSAAKSSIAVSAEARRPAALMRGPMRKPMSTARRGRPSIPSLRIRARRPRLRGSARPLSPSQAMVRFSPIRGATSATVPIAAIFSSDSVEMFLPARRINSQHNLNATPTPASSLNGYAQPGCFGLSTAAASGSTPGGK